MYRLLQAAIEGRGGEEEPFHDILKSLTLGPRSIKRQAFIPITKEEKGLMW